MGADTLISQNDYIGKMIDGKIIDHKIMDEDSVFLIRFSWPLQGRVPKKLVLFTYKSTAKIILFTYKNHTIYVLCFYLGPVKAERNQM